MAKSLIILLTFFVGSKLFVAANVETNAKTVKAILNNTIFDNATLNNSTISINDTEVQLSILEEDKLCLICHLVLKKLKDKSANPQQLNDELTSSCSMLRTPEATKNCLNNITVEKLARLSENSVKKLCVEEKLCAPKEDVTEELNRPAPTVAPLKPIPELKNINEAKDNITKTEIAAQQQQLVKMYAN